MLFFKIENEHEVWKVGRKGGGYRRGIGEKERKDPNNFYKILFVVMYLFISVFHVHDLVKHIFIVFTELRFSYSYSTHIQLTVILSSIFQNVCTISSYSILFY